MSVLHAFWLDLSLVTGRVLGRGDLGDVDDDQAPPAVREGVVDLFVERARETGTSVERIAARDTAAIGRAVGRAGRRHDGTVRQATLGVATSGCLVLTQPRRVSAVPLDLATRVVILPVPALVFGVPEAVALLDRRRGHVWVRGAQGEPDLELDRVGRVYEQPGLHVLLVG